MPEVSVILPTFNRAGTLGRAIDSVLGQTFSDLELLVVDDGSADGTEAVVRARTDSRLRFLRLPANRGAARARNAGLKEARAEWIAFQDSDDEWLPEKLAAQFAAVDSAAGFVLGGYDAVTASGRVRIRPAATLAGHDPVLDVLDGWPIITPTWLIRRGILERLGGFDESYPCLEDWDLAFRIADHATIRAVEGPVLVKHSGAGAVCADPRRLRPALQRILVSHRRRWAGHPVRLARRMAHLACLEYAAGNRDRARALLRSCVAHAPWSLPAWGLLLASFAGARAMGRAEKAFPGYAGMAP